MTVSARLAQMCQNNRSKRADHCGHFLARNVDANGRVFGFFDGVDHHEIASGNHPQCDVQNDSAGKKTDSSTRANTRSANDAARIVGDGFHHGSDAKIMSITSSHGRITRSYEQIPRIFRCSAMCITPRKVTSSVCRIGKPGVAAGFAGGLFLSSEYGRAWPMGIGNGRKREGISGRVNEAMPENR